jgi:hypothetical protein
MSSRASLLCFAALACLIVAAADTSGPATACAVVPRPCDDTWQSSLNQTFAFLAVGPPNFVQLYSYWGSSKGCAAVVFAGNATVNTTRIELSGALCAFNTSVWAYGPVAIVGQYVYYKNLGSGMCLTLNVSRTDPANSSTLVDAPCCSSAASKCTATEAMAQLWLEPATTANPYVRIQSQGVLSDNATAFCLTRLGDAC